MAGRLQGKVAFISGAGRGQGREHAVRFASEGANLIVTDICAPIDSLNYSLSSEEDLEETVRSAQRAGARVVSMIADVRSQDALDDAVAKGVAELGRLDIVVANAGIVLGGPAWEISERDWKDVIDVNLTGVWHTVKAAVPSMIAANNGGSIALIGSLAGMKGIRNAAGYVVAKHGLVGLMRTLANELAPYSIRVNVVNPTNVASDMLLSDANYKLFRPDLENPTKEDAIPAFTALNLIPVPWLEPVDISNALLWLSSDEARYVTGVSLPVDAGGYVRT